MLPRRPELRVIVSSATLEIERFSAFFNDAPVIQVSGRTYPVEEGIPRLFVPTDLDELEGRDVTDMVKQFYEKTPFPNYDDQDSVRSLIDKARERLYARALDAAIPSNASVLEVGCGTGQLTNFLGITCRSVVGTDLCLNSLRLADGFRP